ncbi:MAG: glycosyltransferase family 39 protein [Gemmatimonadota bacterium]
MKAPKAYRLAVALGLLAVVIHLPGLDDAGLTWDEPKYMDLAVGIQEWTSRVIFGPDRMEALSREVIAAQWDPPEVDFYNPHPPFFKIAMAASDAIVGRWMGTVPAMRLASLVWFALLVTAVTLVAGWRWSTAAALGAGLAMLTMPRVVGHAHIAATDTPLTLFWFVGTLATVGFLRTEQRKWLVLGGVAVGLAMATKFTGYLLPVPLFLWILVYHRNRRGLLAAGFIVAVGLGVAILMNPLAWHGPIEFTRKLIEESLDRESIIPINTYYMGYKYGYVVPWHQSPVMLLITTPVPLLSLFLLGTAAALARWKTEAVAALCVLQLVFFMVVMGLPSSPNHDGIRLFLPLFPFLALLMGRGLHRLNGSLRQQVRPGMYRGAALSALTLFYLPPAAQTYSYAPFYLSYYNEMVGGLSGAVLRGFEATYWYDAMLPEFLDAVNELVKPGDHIAVWPSRPYYEELQRYGYLRDDVVITETIPSTYYLQLSRLSNFDAIQWAVYNHVQPVLSVTHDGVELAALYSWASPDSATAEDSD